MAQGAIGEATGGDFLSGFVSGFAGHAAGSVMSQGKAVHLVAVRTAIAATIGGTAAELSGGSFANGAVTAAFVHLFNSELTAYGRKLQTDGADVFVFRSDRESVTSVVVYEDGVMLGGYFGNVGAVDKDGVPLRSDYVKTGGPYDGSYKILPKVGFQEGDTFVSGVPSITGIGLEATPGRPDSKHN